MKGQWNVCLCTMEKLCKLAPKFAWMALKSSQKRLKGFTGQFTVENHICVEEDYFQLFDRFGILRVV